MTSTRILVSGSSGLVGKALVNKLIERGDDVYTLVRDKNLASDKSIYWNPGTHTIDNDHLAKIKPEVVVHLAGEPIIGRWNEAKRQRILDSRVIGTRLIAETIAKLDKQPKKMVCASAVGIYGNKGEQLVSEQTSTPGEGFLAQVVEEWEQAALPAKECGICVSHLRMGAVLSAEGGALKKQLKPFKLGLGGPIGSGMQWMPWVGIDEVINMFCFAIDNDLDGAYNAVGPTPARVKDQAKAIGRALKRPVMFRVPAFVVRRIFGDLADEMLLASQKVIPARFEALGYEFLDRTVHGAIVRALKK